MEGLPDLSGRQQSARRIERSAVERVSAEVRVVPVGATVIMDEETWRAREHERLRLVAELEAALAELASVRGRLAERERELQEIRRLEDRFLSLMSYELRTPLTSILGYLQLVLEGEGGLLSGEQERFLGIVERNSLRLLQLIGDLLLVIQIESGAFELTKGPVDLAHSAEKVVDRWAEHAMERGVELVLDATPLPLFLGDRARIAQVIDNLLSNALKFTPEGGLVTVSVGLAGDRAILQVRDTGIGIAEDELARVFERFSPAKTTFIESGSGLGLAISKAIVEAHEGSIAVETKEGTGTTFTVELPFHRRRGRDSARQPQNMEELR